jgi:hypothetical protein
MLSRALKIQSINLQELLLQCRYQAATMLVTTAAVPGAIRLGPVILTLLVFADSTNHHPNHCLVSTSSRGGTGAKGNKAGSFTRLGEHGINLPLCFLRLHLSALTVQIHNALLPKHCIHPCWCYCCRMHCVTMGCYGLGVVAQQLYGRQSVII